MTDSYETQPLVQAPHPVPLALTDADYAHQAARLGCDIPAIKTVGIVESGGRTGFLADGRLMILCEAHKFSQYTGGKYDKSHPRISSPVWNKALYVGGAGEWDRFNEMAELDLLAAERATSFGAFQVLGNNAESLGFRDPNEMITLLDTGPAAHLQVFVEFVERNGLVKALREHDWATFARGYNGSRYRENQYDTKMADTYARLTAGKGMITLLRIGATGGDVRSLQAALRNHGYSLVVDGHFGRATELAVERFQKARGLTPDGIVGAATRAALAA